MTFAQTVAWSDAFHCKWSAVEPFAHHRLLDGALKWIAGETNREWSIRPGKGLVWPLDVFSEVEKECRFELVFDRQSLRLDSLRNRCEKADR
jgi:hypothetical protein